MGVPLLGQEAALAGIGSLNTGFVAYKNKLASVIGAIGRAANAASVGGAVISRRVPGEGDGGVDVATTNFLPRFGPDAR